MIRRNLSFIIFIIFILLFTTAPFASEEDMTFREYLEKANTYVKTYRHFEAIDALMEATKLGGTQHPSLHMRLGILYYGLGLIPEAIAEGEKAVMLVPSSKWYKYDLAKFYFVDKQFDKAERQITTLLKLDPGFTLGYYYLADLYFQKKEYDFAWLSFQRARQLGFQGKQLKEKLAPFSSKPREDFELIRNDNGLFRFIKLSTSEEAKDALNEISTGKLFENLELELKIEQSDGANFGLMMLSELQGEVADSLRHSQPFSPPQIIQTGSDFRIIQRILPFDRKSWDRTIKPEINSNTALTNTAGPKKQLSSNLAAVYAVENWKMAWSEQNIDEYLATYSSRFIPPGGLSLETWKTKRLRSLTKPGFIHIDIKDLNVEILNENQLLVTFKQSYESDTYQDVVTKALTMAKETYGWKIIQEREIQKLAP